MKHLEFKIDIAAGRKKVWDTMLQTDTYRQWAGASWPGSYYEGRWQQGTDIRFLSPQGGGTVANLVEAKPHESIVAKHVAVVDSEGREHRSGKITEGWVGTLEKYTFSGSDDKTNLTVSIDTTPEWEGMFNDGWPRALRKLKELCELKKT